MSEGEKVKIAILGGGLSSLTAAFELTRTRELRERHEITVYQAGFRLGGKGASGRNPERADRIEEHGLHVLMGFYHNMFRLLRDCYAELGRAPGTPLATIEDAVKPHDFVAVSERALESWETWPMPFPPLPGAPGDGAFEEVSPGGYLKKLLAWANGLFTRAADDHQLAPGIALDIEDVERQIDEPREILRGTRGLGDGDAARVIRVEDFVDEIYAGSGRRLVPAAVFLYLANLLAEHDLFDPGPRFVWLLRRFWSWLRDAVAPSIEGSTPLRRIWIVLDLAITTLVGAIEDRVLTARDGWFSIDDLDLRAWLARHGASPLSCDSAVVRAIYNSAFAGPGQAGAGSAIHGALLLVFGYKQAIFHKMQAGMGDTVFTPLYQVLKRRGVRFEFFHRVDELVLSADRRRIAAVRMGRQARPKGREYDPLYDVDGLPCWPSCPKFAEIEGGEALRASGQNLESLWNSWPDVEARRLELGRDFDAVVLGISIGALPAICPQLIAANKAFADMVEHVKTTQTQAVQLWFTRDLGELGWERESPVLDGYAEPFDSWADMTHLLPRERWPREAAPRNIAYLCSRLEDDEAPPPRGAAEYPDRQRARVKANAIAWLTKEARGLWPNTSPPGAEHGFDWSSLVDPEGRSGVARLDAQYWQATFCPSERYVLSVPGSHRYRLRAHESGFQNLALAGDWVRTGLSIGCAEAAVMAGMQAARAICGRPEIIPGDE